MFTIPWSDFDLVDEGTVAGEKEVRIVSTVMLLCDLGFRSDITLEY